MKNFSFPLFLVSITLLLAACTNSTPTSSEEKHENKQENKATDKSKNQDDSKSQDKSKNQEKEDPKPIDPYEPMKPSDDAKPIKEKLSEEELKNMPLVEAHGEDRSRAVPVGRTLVKGAEDKTDGPLKNNRIIAFYGHPNSTNMGILGEMKPDALMKKLKEQTQAYSDAAPSKPAIPAIELITTVAQRNPGPEDKYYHMTSEDDIEEYANLAKENNALLLLDVQLGKDSVMNQVKLIEKWLKLPYVHLAIDTEFHVGKGETPGIDLGQVDGAEVQKAVDYVSKFVEENNLPDKVVIVHQFTDKAITNKKAIQPTKNVEVVLNYDGWGPSPTKQSLYRKFVRNDTSQYGGFKIFYKKDEPVMKPLDVIKLDPNPAFVNYQ